MTVSHELTNSALKSQSTKPTVNSSTRVDSPALYLPANIALPYSLPHYQCLVACLTQCTVNAFNSNLGGLRVLRFPFCCTFLSAGLQRRSGDCWGSPEVGHQAPGSVNRLSPRWKFIFLRLFFLQLDKINTVVCLPWGRMSVWFVILQPVVQNCKYKNSWYMFRCNVLPYFLRNDRVI